MLGLAAALCLAGRAAAQGDSWDGRAPLPAPRRLLAAAVDGGRVYAFGGCGSPCFQPPLHTSTDEETRVEVYDPRSDSWAARKRIPAVVFGAAAAAPGNGRIYLAGGFVTPGALLEYDPAADAWRPRAAMPTPRHGLAAVALGGRVYAIGGSDGGAASGAVEAYDPVSDTWQARAPLPTPRVFLAAAALGGRIYAVGGSPDCCGNARTAAVEVYDPVRDAWTAAASLPVALQVSAAAVAGGRLYVLGGFVPGEGVQASNFEYDPNAGRWTPRERLFVARDQAPAVTMLDSQDGKEKVLLLGGSTDCHCQARRENHRYTPPGEEPPPRADLRITNTNRLARVHPEQDLRYEVTVTNAGPSAAPGSRVTYSFPPALTGVSWTCRAESGARCAGSEPLRGSSLDEVVDLPVGGRLKFLVDGTVAAGAAGDLATRATVEPPAGLDDPVRPNNSAVDRDPIVACPAPVVTKGDGRSTAAPGERVIYRIAVRNDCAAAQTVTVTDDLAATGLAGAAWCRGEGCVPAATDNLEDTRRIGAGETEAYHVSGTVPCLCDLTELRNQACAAVHGGPPQCAVDVDPIVPAPEADLAVAIAGGALEGCTLPYTITVTNNGRCTAQGVELRAQVSAGFALAFVSSPCAGGFPCALGELPPAPAPGSSVVVTAHLQPTGGAGCPAAGSFAVAVASACDRTPANNAGVAEARVACDLGVAKSASLGAPAPGDPIAYAITVANLCCVPIAGAKVSDVFPPEVEQTAWCRGTDCNPAKPGPLADVLDLPPGKEETYLAVGCVSPRFTGLLVNEAAVSYVGDATDETPANNRATAATAVEPEPGVVGLCEGIGGLAVEGGVITKTFVLWNGGPAAQADNPGDEFTDALPAGLTLVGAAADAGTVATGGNTVTWNGAIGAGERVVIEITATIDAGTAGTTICNEGTVSFDADGNGTNESSAPTREACRPCCIHVLTGAVPIPVLSWPALVALVLLLAALGLGVLRRLA